MEIPSDETDLDRLFGGNGWRTLVTWRSFGGSTQAMLTGLAGKWFPDDFEKQIALQDIWDRHPRRHHGIILTVFPTTV
jgi:hypothetical protein